MTLMNGFMTCVTYLVSYFTFIPYMGQLGDQSVLSIHDPFPNKHGNSHGNSHGPVFKPPAGDPNDDFQCDYSSMKGYEPCSTPGNRSCWLLNPKTNDVFDINTDYENKTPSGITRQYTLDIFDSTINADGIEFPVAKVFNESYPGPWIQACWGDVLNITVNNKMTDNGTSIHWHGIRQLLNVNADGVNGITQCPIAPGDSFVYTFNATQYGSSWYHSHYSVQYADGAAGPLTLYGPSSANYDEAIPPIMMSDWTHNSAFQIITNDFVSLDNDIVLNGVGNITRYNNKITNTTDIPEPYTLFFNPPTANETTKYLLRLTNIAFEASFYFSIDNHMLTVISSDFVPIEPYKTDAIIIGIGQRYNVIVEAKPIDKQGNSLDSQGPFWIRTWRADCFGFNQTIQTSLGYETTGILRYSPGNTLPNSPAWPVNVTDCTDEPYNKLVPVVPWIVDEPVNGDGNPFGENITLQFSNFLDTFYPVAFFSLSGTQYNPIKVDYSNPTFLNLNNNGPWNPAWNVFDENHPPVHGNASWIYIFIKGSGDGTNTFGAHPIHLHGHDFALLAQSDKPVEVNPPVLKTDNPPRRDVVLLPSEGYVIIAFPADNPGTWLMHCHIATHISGGLGLQFMERRLDALKLWPDKKNPAIKVATDGCRKWNDWQGNCKNWWPGDGSACPQGVDDAFVDSGLR